MQQESPNTKTSLTTSLDGAGWQTILFNCDCHEFVVVVERLVLAVGCSFATASQLAHIADQFGQATVLRASRERCEQVATVLGSIGLVVTVTQ